MERVDEPTLAALLEREGCEGRLLIGSPEAVDTGAGAREREDQCIGSSRLLINEADTLVGDVGTESCKSLGHFLGLPSRKEVGVVGAVA